MNEENLLRSRWETHPGIVRTLRLEHYRNYASLDLELGKRFNVVSGPNAQGKTNLLEAIALVSTTQVLRGHKDAEAIQSGFDKALVELELDESGTVVGIQLERGTRKRAALNRMSLPKASDVIGRMPSVCLTSLDLEIVRGEPSERRLFMDLDLSSRYPAYLGHLAHYRRALEQRNALLKSAQERNMPDEAFEAWEDPLAEHGAALRAYRHRFVEALSPVAAELHGQMGQGEKLSLSVELKDPHADSDALRTAYSQDRRHDIHRGTTQLGPHRDDLGVLVDGREAKLFGSQGQQRTAVICLKLASLITAKDELGFAPMLLLDDMLSDLDSSRRTLLVKVILAHCSQALLTCTEAESIGAEILDQATVFTVKDGKITP